MIRKTWQPVVDGRVVAFAALGVASSLTMAATELGFAGALILLMRTLGLLQFQQPFMPFSGDFEWTPLRVSLLLAGMGTVRALAYSGVLSMPLLIEQRVGKRLRRHVLKTVLDGTSMERVPASRLFYLFTEVFPKTARCFGLMAAMIPNALIALVLAGFMFRIEPTSAITAWAGIVVTGALVLRLNRYVRSNSKRQLEPYQGLVRGIQRISANWLMICALRLRGAERERMEGLNEENARFATKAAVLSSTAPVFSALVGIFLLSTLVYVHTHFGSSSGAEFTSMLYLLVRLVQQLNSLSSSFGSVNTFLPFLRETNGYLGLTAGSSAQLVEHHVAPSEEKSSTPPGIAIERLGFRFSSSGRTIIDDLSTTISAGSQFGIVGPSGVGKSTLIALILGVFKPDKGVVLIRGEAAESYLNAHPEELAYVGAEPSLFEGTLRQNLEYGKSSPSSAAQFASAIRDARIEGLVGRLKDGLDHVVKDQGASFSAGERQRLALARALLRDPTLLVLDEFTANLDGETEREIVETIGALRGRCTTIIVSHKPAVLRYCDQVLDMKSKSLERTLNLAAGA